MNILLLKKMSILSAILGFAMGFFCIIPYLNLITFLIIFILASLCVLVFMKINNMIGVFTPKESAAYGAWIGFSAFIAYCFSMVPLAILSSIVNNIWLHKMLWVSGIAVWFKLGLTGILGFVFIAIFSGLIAAMINAFTAMIATYLYDMISGYGKNDGSIDIEINK